MSLYHLYPDVNPYFLTFSKKSLPIAVLLHIYLPINNIHFTPEWFYILAHTIQNNETVSKCLHLIGMLRDFQSYSVFVEPEGQVFTQIRIFIRELFRKHGLSDLNVN